MNSSAAIKAFVGEHGGAVCTSSNCRAVLEWALNGGASKSKIQNPQSKIKILFFPDQHLGRNTAHSMGFPLDRMLVWDPRQDLGGSDEHNLRNADFVLWKGHCSVHALFRPEHVDDVRRDHPNMKVIVHPECRFEVVQKSDLTGSTAYIVKTINAAPPGSEWAIGTEVHLVNRLKNEHPEQKIIVLSECQCLCTTMYRIDLPHLCWVLENLVEGQVVNEIKVDAHTRKWATVALERMLSIRSASQPTGIVQTANVLD
jgi:quinolinate synthase